jgi:hypothetical protein
MPGGRAVAGITTTTAVPWLALLTAGAGPVGGMRFCAESKDAGRLISEGIRPGRAGAMNDNDILPVTGSRRQLAGDPGRVGEYTDAGDKNTVRHDGPSREAGE